MYVLGRLVPLLYNVVLVWKGVFMQKKFRVAPYSIVLLI